MWDGQSFRSVSGNKSCPIILTAFAKLSPVLIDLSHTVINGQLTYPGLPAPIICDFLSREASRALYAEGVEFHIGRIDMVANTGTYLDSPFHRYADGKDLAEVPLESLANLPEGYRGLLRPASVFDGRSGTVFAFRGRRAGGHRFSEHRRPRGFEASRAQHPAGR